MYSSLRKHHPLIKIINNTIIDLPAPSNISTLWNFGSILGLCLIIQIATGLFLAMHYIPHINEAFTSVIHITRDVNFGWIIRTFHANGASWFFICIYLHVGRGIYYNSFFLLETWNIGVIILILTIAAAFIGYVLPWGQIRFWGATVITNLFSAIPYVGTTLVEWIWGGFAVDNATLTRFFALHFLIPFIIAGTTILHILFLHQTGSRNPLGIASNAVKVPIHPFFIYKDLVGFIVLLSSLSFIALFLPNALGDPENFIPANPLVTPVHIMPEWYFLWAYAILRSIPNKIGGVVAIFSALLILIILPLINKPASKSFAFYPPNQILFWRFIAITIILTWIGGRPVEQPYEFIGQIMTGLYFCTYLINPIISKSWDTLLSSNK